MGDLIERLWPFFKSRKEIATDPYATSGRAELIGIFLVSILRTWQSDRVVHIKAELMAITYNRDIKSFYRLLKSAALLSAAASVIYAVHKWLKERLGLVWRAKLTHQLHARYFRSMQFYRLSHLQTAAALSATTEALEESNSDGLLPTTPAQKRKLEKKRKRLERKLTKLRKDITDVQERITRDPRRFCKALAEECEKLSAGLTSGVWFCYRLAKMTSLPFALSPLAYFAVSSMFALNVVPDWSRRWRENLDLRSAYFGAHNRLQHHAESVCAFQGNSVERRLVDRAWDAFIDNCEVFLKVYSKFQTVTSFFFVNGVWSFGTYMILSRFMNPAHPAKATYLSLASRADRLVASANGAPAVLREARNLKRAASAQFFRSLRYLTEWYSRGLSSQGIIVKVLQTLQGMTGPAKRLTALFDKMDFMEAQSSEMDNAAFVDDDSRIAFEAVDVYTPTGVLLVKNLNFTLAAGTNLLLTGCNGSGKSSIFRCLGGLWKVPPGGIITKPGGGGSDGLHSAVFYLPQRPYNPAGTLREQLCYPHRVDSTEHATLTPPLMLKMLDAVELGYLMERFPCALGFDATDDDDVDWSGVLSMGEKQRLAMARLFWHRPRFAILDECTSGVSAAMERKLYDMCTERGISCVTISHRPVLRKYHDLVLNILADGEGGYTHTLTYANKRRLGLALSAEEQGALSAAGGIDAMSSSSASGEAELGGYSAAYAGSEGADASETVVEQERSAQRSSGYAVAADRGRGNAASKGERISDASFLTRLRLVWSALMPNGMSLRDPEARRVLLLVGIIVGKTAVENAAWALDGYAVSTVLQSNYWVFLRAWLTGAIVRSSLTLFEVSLIRSKWMLNIGWRKRLTKTLMDSYIGGAEEGNDANNTFYRLSWIDGRISDPDERITEQVEALSIQLTDLWTQLLRPAFAITFNLGMLASITGAKRTAQVSCYMLATSIVMNSPSLVPNFRKSKRQEFALEGKLRKAHNILIENTESVAFFGGGDVEHAKMTQRLIALTEHSKRTSSQSARFNVLNQFVTSHSPDLLGFWIRMSYALEPTRQEGVGVTAISSVGTYVQECVKGAFGAFGDAFELRESFGSFAGVLESVTDLMIVIDELDEKTQSEKVGGVHLPSTDGSLSFEGVDIVAPGGLCCAANLSFTVAPGQSLIVTGPNGSGKSSLFRILARLWKLPCGVVKSEAAGPSGVFLVPQQCYSVVGSLADQITYPVCIPTEERTDEIEARLIELLDLVGIKRLVQRFSRKEDGVSGETGGSSENERIQAARRAAAETTSVSGSGLDAVQKWEDVLSLGEQQRLAMARLFWHEPKFAVLDECTSAVSIDVEKRLYTAAAEKGITSITISQRLSLEEYHTQQLELGNFNAQGWQLRSLGTAPTLAKEVAKEAAASAETAPTTPAKVKSAPAPTVLPASDAQSPRRASLASTLLDLKTEHDSGLIDADEFEMMRKVEMRSALSGVPSPPRDELRKMANVAKREKEAAAQEAAAAKRAQALAAKRAQEEDDATAAVNAAAAREYALCEAAEDATVAAMEAYMDAEDAADDAEAAADSVHVLEAAAKAEEDRAAVVTAAAAEEAAAAEMKAAAAAAALAKKRLAEEAAAKEEEEIAAAAEAAKRAEEEEAVATAALLPTPPTIERRSSIDEAAAAGAAAAPHAAMSFGGVAKKKKKKKKKKR